MIYLILTNSAMIYLDNPVRLQRGLTLAESSVILRFSCSAELAHDRLTHCKDEIFGAATDAKKDLAPSWLFLAVSWLFFCSALIGP
jgi:hypothetical protein